MPYPADTAHVVLGGAMPGGEQWESGFWIDNPGVTTPAGLNGLCETVFSSLASDDDDQNALTYWITAFANAQTTLAYCRALYYAAAGTKATFSGEYTPPAPIAGSSTAHLPNQIACCVTLRTNLAGRSHRGRMYLPATGASPGADGQINLPTATTFATKWAGFFSDWNTSGDNGQIVVVSALLTSATEVTSVSVDTRLDVQRRRAAKEAITGRSTIAVTQS